jgi:hypothetical protein
MPEGMRSVEKSNWSGIGSNGRMPAVSPCASIVKDR